MWCRDAAAGSLTDRRSQHQALALSPVDGRHAPGNRQALQISCWTSNTSSEQGSDPAAPRVHQQSIQNYRPQEGSPVSQLSERPQQAVVGLPLPHESAALHVTGKALYTDDLVVRTLDVLHAWPVQSPYAHALVTAL